MARRARGVGGCGSIAAGDGAPRWVCRGKTTQSAPRTRTAERTRARLGAHWEAALRRYGNAQAQLPTRTPRDSHATRTASGRRASERRQTSVGARTIVARSVGARDDHKLENETLRNGCEQLLVRVLLYRYD